MSDWIEEEFRTVSLDDQRLNQRLRRLLTYKWQNLGARFSAAGHAEAMAASRFFENEQVTQQKILAPHRAAIVQRIAAGAFPQVLIVQDTTECDYTSHPKLVGAGPLATASRRGFFAHSELVITPERLPLGLWDTLIYARNDDAQGQAAEREKWPIAEKESFRWLQGYRHACALAAEVPSCQVVSVSDREGDIYEVFAESAQRRAQGLPVAELLIRSKEDRCLEACDQAGPDKIRARLAAAPALGTVRFRVPAATRLQKVKGQGPQPVRRSAREVEQEVRAIRIQLKPPHRSAAAGGPLPPVELTVVEAREINPPPGELPLVWVLLTTLPAERFEQAGALLERYLGRWEIELFHKVLKSGCRLEEMQQRFDFTLLPAIVLCMLLAWRLLHVMRLGRECPDLPCDLVFDDSEWKSVVVALAGRAALEPKPSVGVIIRLIARLGGHLGRKKDPPPGMKCLWIGLARMADFAFCWDTFGPAPADSG